MQIVILANDFTSKNSKKKLTNFKNQSKVENLLSFCSKLCFYSTKVTDIMYEYYIQGYYLFYK
jgi:hypothetical protein